LNRRLQLDDRPVLGDRGPATPQHRFFRSHRVELQEIEPVEPLLFEEVVEGHAPNRDTASSSSWFMLKSCGMSPFMKNGSASVVSAHADVAPPHVA
jgi:hypothetical protein